MKMNQWKKDLAGLLCVSIGGLVAGAALAVSEVYPMQLAGVELLVLGAMFAPCAVWKATRGKEARHPCST